MKGRRDRKLHRTPGAPLLRQFYGTLDRCRIAGNNDLIASVIIGCIADLVVSGFCRNSEHFFKGKPEHGGHRASPHGSCLLHRAAADAQEFAVSLMERAPAAAKAEYSPSEWPATHCTSRARSMPASFKNAQHRQRDSHQRRLCVLSQRQCFGRSLPHHGGKPLVQCHIHFVEYCPRRRKCLRKRLSHPDGLAPLARKHESSRHRTFSEVTERQSARLAFLLAFLATSTATARLSTCSARLAFSSEPRINRASARSRPGAERTAAARRRQGQLARRPVFPPSEHSSLSERLRRAWRRDDVRQRGKAFRCRYTNTSILRAKMSARSRSKN